MGNRKRGLLSTAGQQSGSIRLFFSTYRVNEDYTYTFENV
jgi:hypothetical protein